MFVLRETVSLMLVTVLMTSVAGWLCGVVSGM